MGLVRRPAEPNLRSAIAGKPTEAVNWARRMAANP
jgi:hypothetical protein